MPKVFCSVSTFVMKIGTFAKHENVIVNPISDYATSNRWLSNSLAELFSDLTALLFTDNTLLRIFNFCTNSKKWSVYCPVLHKINRTKRKAKRLQEPISVYTIQTKYRIPKTGCCLIDNCEWCNLISKLSIVIGLNTAYFETK